MINKYKKLMKSGTISFYGYSYSNLPEEINDSDIGRIELFFKKNGQKIALNESLAWHSYKGYQDTPWGSKDIVFFDQDAVKSLCIGFPTKSKYVVISLKNPKYYFFILIGLLRRLRLKSISIKGLINIKNGSFFSPWLIIECNETSTNSLNINSEIGVSGFLDFLRKNKIRYVVPRFYEKLPRLPMNDADLDIIVDIKDVNLVIEFLLTNPGEIPIDVYSDRGTDYHGMSYLPPKKAKDILDRAIDGPGGSRIPCKKDALETLIYHALYHKGYISRIQPHKDSGIESNPNNKYLDVIRPLKKELGIEIGDTLEEMDDYMYRSGWKPAIDTLAKIAQWNGWVRDFHRSTTINFLPLYILIIKEGIKGTKSEDLLKTKCVEEGILILEERELVGDIKEKAITDLRGGIWNDSLGNHDEVSNFYPAKILVVWDSLERRVGGISKVKEKLRSLVDTQKTSFIHSTDNYVESLDYIRICMPDRINFYEDEQSVLAEFKNFATSGKKFAFRFQEIVSITKMKLRDAVLSIVGH